MKVQLRRWFTIGLMSGSLALSAIAGSAAVGAASAHEERDYPVAAVTTEAVVTIAPESVNTLSVVSTQVFNDDRRS
jgi:propanediol dehydratase small subunit